MTYEIVLVDGGSTDGTIEWCKDQPDVRLIEQGALLGAIKAFNAGLFAAQGRYCVPANDDIEFCDESLLNAVRFMEDNPNVGVGCFRQDRDHPGHFDVSRMPAVLDGESVQHVYGQVCIVPKWLGDEVGWWGDVPGLYTYGGDNNLSSFVLERGYRVTVIECSCIVDLQVNDELRRINNAYRQTQNGKRMRGHPDSNLWGDYWTHSDGTCGAIIRHDPYKPNPLERLTRFLYLPIYEMGHDIQRHQKRGLRGALSRYGIVQELDWQRLLHERGGQYMINYVMDMIDVLWKPDIMITQIHSPDMRGFNESSIQKIRKECPDFIWVNWNGDWHPEDLLSSPNVRMASLFDMQCVVSTAVREAYSRAGVNWMYWQIGYEESTAEPTHETPAHDVVFLANGYSHRRIALGRMLRSLPHDVGIYGSWGTGVTPNGSNLYNFDEGRKLYRNAKLSIGDDQWKAPGFVSNRLFQAMEPGGAMYMQQRVPDLDRLLGLEDGKHYVAWDDLGDLQGKIEYWLARDDERTKIAHAGAAIVRERHSFDARIRELMECL